MGDHVKEEELLAAGLRSYGTFDKLWMMAAQAAERRSDLVKAREHYLRGLDKCAKSSVLWSLAAKLEETASGVVKARSVLELARLKNRAMPRLWLEAVRLEARNGQEKLATTLLASPRPAAHCRTRQVQCMRSVREWQRFAMRSARQCLRHREARANVCAIAAPMPFAHETK